MNKEEEIVNRILNTAHMRIMSCQEDTVRFIHKQPSNPWKVTTKAKLGFLNKEKTVSKLIIGEDDLKAMKLACSLLPLGLSAKLVVVEKRDSLSKSDHSFYEYYALDCVASPEYVKMVRSACISKMQWGELHDNPDYTLLSPSDFKASICFEERVSRKHATILNNYLNKVINTWQKHLSTYGLYRMELLVSKKFVSFGLEREDNSCLTLFSEYNLKPLSQKAQTYGFARALSKNLSMELDAILGKRITCTLSFLHDNDCLAVFHPFEEASSKKNLHEW